MGYDEVWSLPSRLELLFARPRDVIEVGVVGEPDYKTNGQLGWGRAFGVSDGARTCLANLPCGQGGCDDGLLNVGREGELLVLRQL